MIIISNDVVANTPVWADLNSPVFGIHNLVTEGSLWADSEDQEHRLANLTDPNTWQYWRPDPGSGDSYANLAVSASGLEPLDYVGIARHNFGSARIMFSILGVTSYDSNGDPEYVPLIDWTLVANDAPIIVRLPEANYITIHIVLDFGTYGTDIPRIAVLYVGKLLVSERRIYVGHSPITLNRQHDIVAGRSENANFLGRIVLQERNSTQVALQNLTPDWYRTYFDPFVDEAVTRPFFFAWRPMSYPNEVGYAWLRDDPSPSNQSPNGMMQVGLNLAGIVK